MFIFKKKYTFSLFARLLSILSYLSLFLVTVFITFNFLDYINFFKEYNQFQSLRKINEIILGHEDSSAKTPSQYFEIFSRGITFNLRENQIKRVNLILNYENMMLIEKGRINKNENNWARATFQFDDEKNLNKQKKIKVKLRAKGDRLEHRKNFNTMSFKVDVRGDNLFMGMEEFSIQKPKLRNYAWEPLMHSLLKKNKLLALNYFPIYLSINGKDHGIYMIEESFGKEVIERNNNKNGPIYSINESYNEIFPNIIHEVYSEKYWQKNDPSLLDYSKKTLYDLRSLKINDKLGNYFDLQKWALFFAINDVLSTYHGAIEKSVKLYFNPVTAKFEPIAFDGHHQPGFDNFILLDLISENFECIKYICDHRKWFDIFLLNNDFQKKYIQSLNYVTSDEFKTQLDEILDNEIFQLNNLFYSQFYRSDSLWVKGLRLYYFDRTVIYNKIKLIKAKLGQFSNYKSNLSSFSSIISKENNVIEDLNRNDINILSFQNITLSNQNFMTDKNKIILLRGENYLKNVKFSGPFMIVQYGGGLIVDNLELINNKNFKIDGTTWSGAFNIINANFNASLLELDSNDSEDSINIINSKFKINTIKIQNSKSDAIDVDFGSGELTNISCRNIGNDCLDISGSKIYVDKFFASNIQDKALSIGEKSSIHLHDTIIDSASIGVVSKDGSNANIENFHVSNTKLFSSAFTKKNMFGDSSSLNIKNGNMEYDLFNNNSLVGKNSKIFYRNANLNKYKSSSEIENLMYGHVYGVKTIR